MQQLFCFLAEISKGLAVYQVYSLILSLRWFGLFFGFSGCSWQYIWYTRSLAVFYILNLLKTFSPVTVNMPVISVKVSDEVHRELVRMASDLGITVSELVREIFQTFVSGGISQSAPEDGAQEVVPDVGYVSISPRDHYSDGGEFSSYRIRLMWQPRGKKKYFIPLYIYVPRSEIFPGFPVYVGDRFIGGLVDGEIDRLLLILRELKHR